MKSQPTKTTGNSNSKFRDEQLTSEAVRQHARMAMGRPIPQDTKEKIKKVK